nr:hypothetical protein [Tanacetum cinerariifolium]
MRSAGRWPERSPSRARRQGFCHFARSAGSACPDRVRGCRGRNRAPGNAPGRRTFPGSTPPVRRVACGAARCPASYARPRRPALPAFPRALWITATAESV